MRDRVTAFECLLYQLQAAAAGGSDDEDLHRGILPWLPGTDNDHPAALIPLFESTFVAYVQKMFAEPPSSRLDVRFRLFGIPIRVHPMFWLIAVLLGWRLPVAEQILWVVVVFFSILVHEMGHAFSARALGWRTHVVLHSLGGLTIFDEKRPMRLGWQQASIAFSGPCAGFVLAGVVYTLMPLLVDTRSGALGALYFHLLWVNIVWGLVNLLPVWPLDGGQMARSLMVEFAGDRGFSISSILSFVSAGIAAFTAWQFNQPYIAVFFAYFALVEWESSL